MNPKPLKRLARVLRTTAQIGGLGPTPIASAALMVTWLEFRLRRRIGSRSARNRRLRVKYDTRQFECVVSSAGDIQVLRDIFLDSEYDLPEDLEPRTIIDLGSNIGLSVVFFKLRYPDAQVIAVEPDARAFELLKENTAPFSGVQLLYAAAGAADGKTTLYQSDLTWRSSTTVEQGAAPGVTVRAYGLDSLIEKLSSDEIDLLKLDVEGAELEILAGSRRLKDIRCVVGELHTSSTPLTAEEFLKMFEGCTVDVRPKGEDLLFRARRLPS